MRISQIILFCAVLHAGMAEARFGKGGSGGGSSSGGSRGGSSGSSTHSAVPVDSRGSSSRSSGSSSGSSFLQPSFRTGYFGGAFVPMYGFGYNRYPSGYPVVVTPEEETVEAALRVTAGAEFLYLANQARGYALGLNIAIEGERFGFSVAAQHLTVAADNGTNGNDTLQQLSAHAGYAFLTGERGRLRAEVGVDVVFATDVVLLAPTVGFSGMVWITGPLAIEGSIYGSVYPFWQLDGRAGIVVGMGALGLRLGLRAQLLDDQGVVDGVAHRDLFMGPYAGLGFVF